MEIARNLAPSHPTFWGRSRSSEPTQVDHLPVDFLLMIHYMGLSCTASEINGDFGYKSQLLPILCT